MGLWPLPEGLTKGEGGCVGYHPECPRGSGVAPALIVLMRNIETFEPQAIQRIFLEVHDDGRVSKSGAMMLGPAGNAAMMLSGWDEIFYGREVEEGPVRLHVCEGFETGLALYIAGVRPLWALGSAGAIARFPPIDSISELVICADNDLSEAGLKAAEECMARWKAAGRQAMVRLPPEPGTDWCDHLTGLKVHESMAAPNG